MEKRNQSGSDQLQGLLDDYRFLEDDKTALEDELRETRSMNHDLAKANDELKDRLERMTTERDKLQAYAVNITTRVQVFGEMAHSLIQESGRHAIAAASRQQERRAEAERVGRPLPEPRPYRMRPLEQQERPVAQDPPDEELTELVGRIARTAPPANKF